MVNGVGRHWRLVRQCLRTLGIDWTLADEPPVPPHIFESDLYYGDSAARLFAHRFQPLASLFGPGAAAVVFEILPPMGGRFLGPSELHQDVGDVPVCVGIIGMHGEGDGKRLECRLQFAVGRVNRADLRPGLEIVVLGFDGRVIAFERPSALSARYSASAR